MIQRLGGPEVLELRDLPIPEPRVGEVRLRVEGVGLNFADILTVRGEYLTRTRLPLVPGMEFAGVVDALGEGVSGLRVGQRVAALGGGGLAEYATVSAGSVIPVPESLSGPEAAAFPVSFYTAYFSLRTLGMAREGEWVLVQAAAGALGTASVQLAKRMGLRVIATASSDAKLDVARSLGADVTFLSHRPDLVSAVKDATGGRGVDVTLEVVGGRGFQDSLAMTAFRGRVLVIGSASQEPSSLRPVELMKRNISVTGVWLTSMTGDAEAMGDATRYLTDVLASGEVRPVVGRTFALEQTGEAFEFIMSRASTGKVVVVP
jgi:NADPH2:quinone reductase